MRKPHPKEAEGHGWIQTAGEVQGQVSRAVPFARIGDTVRVSAQMTAPLYITYTHRHFNTPSRKDNAVCRTGAALSVSMEEDGRNNECFEGQV